MDECSCKSTPPLQRLSKAPAWSCGTLPTPAGVVYRVSTEWSRSDFWGQIKSRTSAYRMSYTIPPGLYATGTPDGGAPVLVTANYKLSFDLLRRELKNINAWLLVLDTKGINVWCAAGKGTFGTKELVNRIMSVQLDKVVDHRKIIVPQLGAPGVSSKMVRQETGFSVSFGPVRAADIREYLDSGFRASREMRTVRFTMSDRAVLTPMEINPAMKKYPLFAAAVVLMMGLEPEGILFRDILNGGIPLLVLGFLSVMIGAFFTPLLLPFIPSRSFAIKGWITGMIGTLAVVPLFLSVRMSGLLLLFSCLFFPLASSYIALQFTGSTPYTGISGVKKELKIGIPVYISGTAVSLILLIIFKLIQWRII